VTRTQLPSNRRLLRLAVLVLLVGQLGVALIGVATAYWRGSGTGSGSGTTGTTVAVTLGPGSSAATLYPGGSADLVLEASNPNAAPLHIGTVTLDTSRGTSGFAVDASHSGCGLSTLSFVAQTNGGAGWLVPARSGAANGTLELTLTNALSMDVTAATACQGAMFTVYLAAGS
jgi:hypothetical protein